MARLLPVVLAAVVAFVGLADSVEAANNVVAAPSATDTRVKVQHWVAAQGVTDKAVLERIGKAWAFDKQSMSGSRVLDMVVGTFSSVDAKTKSFIESCKLEAGTPVPAAGILEGKDAFYTANMQLFYGRFLAQKHVTPTSPPQTLVARDTPPPSCYHRRTPNTHTPLAANDH